MMMLKNENRKHRKMVLTWKIVSVEYKPSKCTDVKGYLLVKKSEKKSCFKRRLCGKSLYSKRREKKPQVRKNKLRVLWIIQKKHLTFILNKYDIFILRVIHIHGESLHCDTHELWILKYIFYICKKDTCDYFMNQYLQEWQINKKDKFIHLRVDRLKQRQKSGREHYKSIIIMFIAVLGITSNIYLSGVFHE